MGLLDKAKAQAEKATAAAKDAAQKGQARLDAMQATRAADVLLRQLGAAVYSERTGRAAETESEEHIERIVALLKAHEAEHGEIQLETVEGG